MDKVISIESFGLNEKRSYQIAKTLYQWESLTKNRAFTKKDLDNFTKTILGVPLKEVMENWNEIKSGQLQRTNELVEKASKINEMDPETLKFILKKFLVK